MNQFAARLAVFLAGLIFGVGLVVSGMSNPAKVIGFLDIAGNWDPSLAFVISGGLLVTVPAFWLLLKCKKPLFVARFELPTKKDIDGSLVIGAVLFGIGWGIAGFCPGPAIAALATLEPNVVLFVVAMLAGMTLHRFTPG